MAKRARSAREEAAIDARVRKLLAPRKPELLRPREMIARLDWQRANSMTIETMLAAMQAMDANRRPQDG